jgi:hypothetical protein
MHIGHEPAVSRTGYSSYPNLSTTIVVCGQLNRGRVTRTGVW